MLVTDVTCGAMVVFSFVVGNTVMLVTGVKDSVIVVSVFVVSNVVMLVTGVNAVSWWYSALWSAIW
jgi:hypothetical protein